MALVACRLLKICRLNDTQMEVDAVPNATAATPLEPSPTPPTTTTPTPSPNPLERMRHDTEQDRAAADRVKPMDLNGPENLAAALERKTQGNAAFQVNRWRMLADSKHC